MGLAVRYPFDKFDRLWVNAKRASCKVRSSNSSIPVNITNENVNNVPPRVMSNGWSANQQNGSECILIFPTGSNNVLGYTSFYFTAPESSAESAQIRLNGALIGQPFKISGVTVKTFEHIPLPTNEVYLDYESSADSVALSAVEIHKESTFDPTTTDDVSGNVISLVKDIYKLDDWQGDPCNPVPYDWITCEPQSIHFRTSINSISLSNLNDSNQLLRFDNSFVPFSNLNKLSLRHSNINNSIASYLLNNLSYDNLEILDFGSNFITNLEGLVKSDIKTIVSLDISDNRLKGQVPSLINMSSAGTIRKLNFSQNDLTSFPMGWGNPSTDTSLSSLITLDLSNNRISNNISLLNDLVLRNNLSLRAVDISRNEIKGEFPSEVYFDALKHIRFMNASHNHIGRVLNLTLWHKYIQTIINGPPNTTHFPVNQIFDFTNNDIAEISPTLDELQSTIKFFLQQMPTNFDHALGRDNKTLDYRSTPLFNRSDILLGGNPYCKTISDLTQAFFCRSSIYDTYFYNGNFSQSFHQNWIFIGILVGGIIFILCSNVLVVKVWLCCGRFRRKVRFLRSIEKILADRKVKPPFYSYPDMKFATRDFHEDNILGKGGFGIVYKGVLTDGTTIAVKKLLCSNQEEQVLNEFLNEVALITGIKHRNLAQLKGCCIKEQQRMLIYEFAEQGNLAEALWGDQAQNILDWRKRFNLCVNIARGLAYLHEELQPRIIHRDIKASNILLDNTFNPKIADFGLAKSILEEETRANFTQFAGTRGYMAPEYWEGQLTAKADVFSFGILVLEIVSGRKCIDPSLPEDQVYIKTWAEMLQKNERLLDMLQFELKNHSLDHEIMKVIDVALICVQNNPRFRPTMSQVVTMFIGNIDLAQFLNVSHQHRNNFDDVNDVLASESDELPLPLLSVSSSLMTRGSNSGTDHLTESLSNP